MRGLIRRALGQNVFCKGAKSVRCGIAALQTNARKRSAALEEVRAAVEELVLTGGQAAELSPRSADIMQAQASPLICQDSVPPDTLETQLRIHYQHGRPIHCSDHSTVTLPFAEVVEALAGL